MTGIRKYVGAAVAVLAVVLTVGVASPADAAGPASTIRPIGCC